MPAEAKRITNASLNATLMVHVQNQYLRNNADVTEWHLLQVYRIIMRMDVTLVVSERDEENARVMTCAVTCPIDVLDVEEDHRDGQRLNQQSLMVDAEIVEEGTDA